MDKLKLKQAVKVTPPKNPIRVVFKLLFVCISSKINPMSTLRRCRRCVLKLKQTRSCFFPASFTHGTVNCVWSTQSKLSL